MLKAISCVLKRLASAAFCAALLAACPQASGQEPPKAAAPVQAQSQEASEKGTVSANKLNVRVLPGLGHSVVAALAQGDALEIKSINGDWLEIAAPKSSAVWVASSFVDNGVISKRAHLRAGPGVAYESFGIAEPGDKVKILDSSKESWLKIEPAPGLVAYVYASMVKIEPEARKRLLEARKDKAPGDASRAAEPQAIAPKEDAQAAPGDAKDEAALQKEEQIVQEAQAELTKSGVMEGLLLPVKDGRGIATHALAVLVNGEYHPICYLRSSSFNLNLWERRKVRVKGAMSWVENWRRPLVDIELITPIWQ